MDLITLLLIILDVILFTTVFILSLVIIINTIKVKIKDIHLSKLKHMINKPSINLGPLVVGIIIIILYNVI
jgi:hypothetical protein